MTLPYERKSLTNATKGFILDVAIVFLRYFSVKQLLKSIKNRLKLIYLFSYYYCSLNRTLITNTNFFDRWFTMHYNFVEKLLSAHRFGYSVFLY